MRAPVAACYALAAFAFAHRRFWASAIRRRASALSLRRLRASRGLTQEELAEHIKRIRNDHCKGILRDTLNRYVPRPAGPRTAIMRVPEPLAMHEVAGSDDEALALLRERMQEALDGINGMLGAAGRLKAYPNPFREG